MSKKQQLAAQAVDAGTVAAQIVNDYGINSPEAYKALQTASQITDKAAAAGCTAADYDNARRR